MLHFFFPKVLVLTWERFHFLISGMYFHIQSYLYPICIFSKLFSFVGPMVIL